MAHLLAHIAEIQYFWMEKAVLITKEDDPNITRSDVENDRGAAAVADHAGDPLYDLIRGLGAANESTIAATGKIPAEDLATLGHRGEDNPITVEGGDPISSLPHGGARPPDHNIPAAYQRGRQSVVIRVRPGMN